MTSLTSLLLQSASRDPQRSPMQWSSSTNAGFNNKTDLSWLPVHPDYTSVNVEVQLLVQSVEHLPSAADDLQLMDRVTCFFFFFLSGRSRKRMKAPSYPSTVSSARCVSQSCLYSEAGSATSTPTPMCFRT